MERLTAFGVRRHISGGPQEIVVKPDQIVWTLGGLRSGARFLTLPQGWATGQGRYEKRERLERGLSGGAQAAPSTIVFTPTAPR